MGDLAIVLLSPEGDGPTELAITGPLTHATTPALRDYLRRLLDTTTTSRPRILLDLSRCTSIDVDGLLARAVAQNAAQARGGDLHLTHTPPPIAHQIRQHNLEHLLPDPTTDEA